MSAGDQASRPGTPVGQRDPSGPAALSSSGRSAQGSAGAAQHAVLSASPPSRNPKVDSGPRSPGWHAAVCSTDTTKHGREQLRQEDTAAGHPVGAAPGTRTSGPTLKLQYTHPRNGDRTSHSSRARGWWWPVGLLAVNSSNVRETGAGSGSEDRTRRRRSDAHLELVEKCGGLGSIPVEMNMILLSTNCIYP